MSIKNKAMNRYTLSRQANRAQTAVALRKVIWLLSCFSSHFFISLLIKTEASPTHQNDSSGAAAARTGFLGINLNRVSSSSGISHDPSNPLFSITSTRQTDTSTRADTDGRENSEFTAEISHEPAAEAQALYAEMCEKINTCVQEQQAERLETRARFDALQAEVAKLSSRINVIMRYLGASIPTADLEVSNFQDAIAARRGEQTGIFTQGMLNEQSQ